MEQKIPKETTLNKWKAKYSWLKILTLGQKKKMICTVCTSQEEQLKLMPRVNLAFVAGTTNFKLSTLNEHENTDGHKRAIREEENHKAVAAGIDLAPRKIVQETPAFSAIGSGFKKMGDKEKEALTKLHTIAHYNAVKGRPYLDFKDLIELEKLQC